MQLCAMKVHIHLEFYDTQQLITIYTAQFNGSMVQFNEAPQIGLNKIGKHLKSNNLDFFCNVSRDGRHMYRRL